MMEKQMFHVRRENRSRIVHGVGIFFGPNNDKTLHSGYNIHLGRLSGTRIFLALRFRPHNNLKIKHRILKESEKPYPNGK